jgi:hypothetical protein
MKTLRLSRFAMPCHHFGSPCPKECPNLKTSSPGLSGGSMPEVLLDNPGLEGSFTDMDSRHKGGDNSRRVARLCYPGRARRDPGSASDWTVAIPDNALRFRDDTAFSSPRRAHPQRCAGQVLASRPGRPCCPARAGFCTFLCVPWGCRARKKPLTCRGRSYVQ